MNKYLITWIGVSEITGFKSEYHDVIVADSPREALDKLWLRGTGKIIITRAKVELANGREVCEQCGVIIPTDEGFEGDDGAFLCENCADDLLTIPDIMRDWDYPYVYGDGDWEDGQYYGEAFKKRGE